MPASCCFTVSPALSVGAVVMAEPLAIALHARNLFGDVSGRDIGILGVDKKGTEHYQITLGGSPGDDAAIGDIVGPSFPAEEVPDAIEKIVDTYLAQRRDEEGFLATYARVGADPFKEALYGTSR